MSGTDMETKPEARGLVAMEWSEFLINRGKACALLLLRRLVFNRALHSACVAMACITLVLIDCPSAIRSESYPEDECHGPYD